MSDREDAKNSRSNINIIRIVCSTFCKCKRNCNGRTIIKTTTATAKRRKPMVR